MGNSERATRKSKVGEKMNIKHTKPQLTIFADASMHHKKRKAGYGCWIISNDKPWETFSGFCKWYKDSAVVKMEALHQALNHAYSEQFIVQTTSAIILQSDNLQTLNILKHLQNSWAVKSRHPKDSTIKRAREVKGPFKQIQKLVCDFDVVYLRHVKGHISGSGQHTINGICDTLAKKAMHKGW